MADSKLQPLLDAAAKATPDIVGCLACPFCGQYPTRYEIPAHSHPHIPWMPDFKGCYVVECGACDYHFLRDTEAEVVAAWNTRAPSSLELRLREYVKECREADPDDEGDAMRQLCADRIESLMEGKP